MTSLHTKYRPLTLDDVVGQDQTVRSLKHVIKDNRAKTFVFTGPSGCGKTTLARILANSFAQGQATVANIEEIDAASYAGVENIRALITRSLYRAVGASPIKAYIIDECHRLSKNAWDVLLKPSEEPPKHVYWMFCSTEPAKLPATIKTRCLPYAVKAVKEETLLELVAVVAEAEKFTIDDDILEAIAEGAGGSPRQALVYLEACAHCASLSEARQIMRSAGESREAIDLCRFLVSGRGGWPDAIKIIKGLEGQEAESVRIITVNYLCSMLMNTQTENKAKPLLGLLECFSTPYQQSDRMAPLLRSVGLALGMDQ